MCIVTRFCHWTNPCFWLPQDTPNAPKTWESRPCPWAPQVEGSVQEKAGLIIAVQACELLVWKKRRFNVNVRHDTLPHHQGRFSPGTWMSQEVSSWLVNGLYYILLINVVYWGYNPFTIHLPTSWDIQAWPIMFLPGYLNRPSSTLHRWRLKV